MEQIPSGVTGAVPWGAVDTGVSSSGISSWPQTWQSLSARRGPYCQPTASGKATSSQCLWYVPQHVGSFAGLLRSCQVWRNLSFSRNIQVQDLMLVFMSSLPLEIKKHFCSSQAGAAAPRLHLTISSYPKLEPDAKGHSQLSRISRLLTHQLRAHVPSQPLFFLSACSSS